MGIGISGHVVTYDVADLGEVQGTTNVIIAHDITSFDRVEFRSDIAANSDHNSATLDIDLQMTWDTANDGNETWTTLYSLTQITTGASTVDTSIIRDASTQLGVKHRLNMIIATATPNGPWSGTVKVVYST